MVNQTRREFLKLGLAAAASAAVASGIEIPVFGAQNSSIKNQLTDVQTRVKTLVGFVSLSITEQSLLEKIVETIIPTDTDPGARPLVFGLMTISTSRSSKVRNRSRRSDEKRLSL